MNLLHPDTQFMKKSSEVFTLDIAQVETLKNWRDTMYSLGTNRKVPHWKREQYFKEYELVNYKIKGIEL